MHPEALVFLNFLIHSMADSSPVRLLSPKRLKLSTNWEKCIVCQSKRDETLKEATDISLASFVNAVSDRRDDVYLRIENNLSSITDQKVVWHRSCYKTYTNKSNIARKTQKESGKSYTPADSFSHLTKLRSTRSSFDESLCVFCQKVYCKRDKSLHTLNTESVYQNLNTAMDEALRSRFSTLAENTNGLKYHLKCYRNFMYQGSKSASETHLESVSKPVADTDPFSSAFYCLTEEIDNDLFIHGKAISLKSLLSRYKCLLGENIDTSSYRTEKLQTRLKEHYGDRVVIQSQRGRSKSSIIFSSLITVGQAITAATALKDSTTEMSLGCFGEDLDTENDSNGDNSNVLYHAAKSLRSMAQGVKEKAQSSQTISTEHAESLIPDGLYMFIRWLIEDDVDSNPISGQKEKCFKPETHRRILSIAQDILFACNRGILTPKHIGIGVTVKHLTGSKEVIKLLNRFGHSISYDEVIKLEKGLAQQTLIDQGENSVAIPANISAGTFDNLDFNEQTLDGKNTTHATTLVLYQRTENGNFGAEVKTKLSKPQKAQTERKLSTEIIKFSKQCRKVKLPSCLFGGENTQTIDLSSKKTAESLDMAWTVARMCPSKDFQVSLDEIETQTVPAWSAFNAHITSNAIPLTSIGYCPMIPAPPTEYSTVYTVMKTVQNMMKVLQQKHTVLTFDEAIYSKAKEIQWRCQDEFKDTVIRLGGFHTAMTFISLIGKRYEESGLEDLLVEAGVYGSGSVMKIMNGKSYNKGVRALKLLMEALNRIRINSLAPKLKDKTACLPYIESVTKLREAISETNEEVSKRLLKDIESKTSAFCTELNSLREIGRKESATFAFWDEFIEMVEILLRFIRADREGLWNLHLDALSEMLPYFFAYDRINYSRWASVYLADMKSLARTAKEVYDEFLAGNHPVKRASGSFNQVWTDLALEQSVNKDSKVKGGIIGFTQNKDAVDRWFLTAHTRAQIVSSTKAMYESTDRESRNVSAQPHKESGKLRMERDERDVQALIDTLKGQMLNPFDTSTHKSSLVMNLVTGMTSSDLVSKDIMSAKDIGKQFMEEFVTTRLVDNPTKNVMDPIRKNKLKTLSVYRVRVKVVTDKSNGQTLDADRGFFSRLIVVAKSRAVDLKAVLTHELSPVPYSLAHPDSSLRKTQKSKLLHIIEGEGTSIESPPTSDKKSAWIYDGMALVQKFKSLNKSTFGEYAESLLDTILKTFEIENCERVDIVFDRYDRKDSIKTSERLRRQKTGGLFINIHGPKTQLPRQWTKFMDSSVSKANLAAFLSEYISSNASSRLAEGKSLYIAGGFENGKTSKCVTMNGIEDMDSLYTDQEEADTRMLLHAFHAMSDCPKITIDSPDTDVAILCVYYFESLNNVSELYFYTGTADKRRFIPIHDISRAMGPTLSRLILPFHALTGCDSTSAVCKLGKVKPWRLLQDNPTAFQDLSLLGTSVDVASRSLLCAERFFCEAFRSKHTNINEARYDMFCKKFTRTEDLPPTKDSLIQHVNRANYQTLIWKSALDLSDVAGSPVGHGWEKHGDDITPTLMTMECAPKSLLVVVSCGCVKSECRGRCSCQKAGLACIESCSCGAGESCKNPCKTENDDNDSDDETDEDENDNEEEIPQ